MKNSLLIILISIILIVSGAEAKENPVEIGSVDWGRDLEVALKKSTATGRPVLVLFQEVPGCIGCQDFGRDVLTIPPLVKAIENEFIPVLVYNNRSGADSEILNRFRERAWNYQVIRFLNGKGLDIIPRKDRVWSLGGVAARMVEALKTAKRPIPEYLVTIAEENNR